MSAIYANILTIGDEILYGQITDTNSQWISAELDKLGFRVKKKISIGDQKEIILQTLKESLAEASIVIITGGLGPTNDDITKKTIAEYFNVPMTRNQEVFDYLAAYFEKRGREFAPLNQTQADIPANAQVIPNTRGTAPGMWFEHEGKVIISLPGVPYEMKGILSDSGLEKLRQHFNPPVILHRVIKTGGIGESTIAVIIKDWEENLPEHIRLAYLPSAGEVKLRLTGTGTNREKLSQEIEVQIQQVLPLIQTHVYGFDEETWESSTARWLKENNYTIATAESCTGGYVAHLLTLIPGSSAYFKGSVIAYSNEVKSNLLDVPSEILQKHGAVSEPVVEQMAKDIRQKMNTTFGIATSGIAGPDGGTPEKPVGTVWIAVASESKVSTQLLQLTAMRDVNIRLTALNVFKLLRKHLQ
ncbi:MAG: competence/damage-inducible protein A [Cytophagaceae bacterium]